MEKGQLHFPDVIGKGDGEEAGVLVINVDKIDAVIRSKGCKPQSLPVKQILRGRQGDPGTDRREGRVSHHVALERFDKRDTRVLAAATTVGPPLVIRFGLQRDAEPLDSGRVAGTIELHAGYAEARVIALRDQTREQV